MKKRLIFIIIAACIVAFVIVNIIMGNFRLNSGSLLGSMTMGSEDLLKVDGNIVTAQEARVFLIAATGDMNQTYGHDVWDVPVGDGTMADVMTESVREDIIIMMKIVAIGEEEGVELNDTERSHVQEAADYYFSQLTSGESQYLAARKTEIEQAFEHYAYAMKTMEVLAGRVDDNISDDEARIITVKQIVTTDQAAAQRVVDLFNAGNTDVDNLASNYSISSLVQRQIGREDVPQAYADAAFALTTGAISAPFEADGNWYVVYCANNLEAEQTAAHRAELLRERQQAAFMEIYQTSVEGLNVVINDGAWDDLEFYGPDLQTEVTFWSVYENYFG